MPARINSCWMREIIKTMNRQNPGLMLTGMLVMAWLLGVPAVAAQSDMDQRQLEMEQLQAQVDVMLEEVNELQYYRICAEKGKVYKPEQTNRADTDGCVLPTTLPPPQTAAGAKPAVAPKGNQANPSAATGDAPIAPTAKTFSLPSAAQVEKDVPLTRLDGGVRAERGLRREAAAPANQPREQTAPEQLPEQSPEQSKDPVLGNIPAQYPNDRVRRLIEAAVDKALTGKDPSAGSLADENRPENNMNAPRRPDRADVETPDASPEDVQRAHRQAVENLVPSCRQGEFLTTVDGKVVCQKAASASKLACPPRMLRVYLSRIDRHLHYPVEYTPHGQTQTRTEANHEIKVVCKNGDYSLQTVTRHECGGRHCHPSRKPAYSQTFYCNKDNTGRCYAKQNGNLVNHTFMEATISRQY